jgi:GcrA cell cycle regulator
MTIWNDESVALVRELWAEGLSAAQIAKRLGGATRNSVIGKVHRLGLAARATPARPVTRASRREVGLRLKRRPPRPGEAEAPRSAVVVDLHPYRFDDGKVATVLSVTSKMCKFPIGDPGDAAFAFCGREACRGPYCLEHAVLTYRPRPSR